MYRPKALSRTSSLRTAIPQRFPPGYGDWRLEKGLDRFYQEPENLRFPISAALRIFAMRVEGKSQAQIDSMLSVFRTMLKDSRGQFRIYDVAGQRSKANR